MSRYLARASALLAIGLAVSAVQGHAQPAPVLLTPPNEAKTTDKPLTLEECISLAMRKNFDLQIQSFSTDIAKENLKISQADFLPVITASSDRVLNRSSQAVDQPDGTTKVIPRDSNTTNFNAGISERIAQTNGTVNLGGNLSRSSSQNPPFGSGITGSISQPLLKNAGPTVAKANIERNKLGLSIAYLNYRSRVLTVIRDTEAAYFNLVSARETVRIRQLTLDRNLALFEENKARRTTGVMTDLDVLTAEFGVATARRALVTAQQTVADREDALLNLINTPDFQTRPGPVAFNEYKAEALSFNTSYKLARDNYPDTMTAEQTIKQLEIDLATAKRNQLPTLNLTASVNYNTNNLSYGEVINTLPDDHGDRRTLGLTYSMPWGMKADQARYRSATASRNAQKARLEQLEQNLLVSVRTAIRAVEANLVAVDISAKATELSAKQYDLQKARFDAGLSTSRLVLQAQEDLETARFNELSAKVALRQAISEVKRLEGSSITNYGVQLPQ
jgi:outer membrane protein